MYVLGRLAVPEQSLGTAGLQDGVYMSPQWGESPPTEDVEHISIDVLKGGSLLQTIPIVPEKTFFTFGRAPVSDVRVDHTSTSRLHAVLQFRGRAAFLVDMGSTHGSTLHGHRLEPYLFHRVNVGSQFVLGQSTRSYVFNAPQVCLTLIAFVCPSLLYRVDKIERSHLDCRSGSLLKGQTRIKGSMHAWKKPS